MRPDLPDDPRLGDVEASLREHGARFAFVHGSTVTGAATASSDLDVAAWFGEPVDPVALVTAMPAGVDLLVLDTAALELAGRVAQHGVLLFDVDPAERVDWQATTRKIYFDERPRIDRARQDFAAARRRG